MASLTFSAGAVRPNIPPASVAGANPAVLRGSTSAAVAPSLSDSDGRLGSAAAVMVGAAAGLAAAARRGAGRAQRRRTTAAASRVVPVQGLLEERAAEIAQLRDLIKDTPEVADYDDVKLLRYLEQNTGDVAAAAANVQEVVAWRKGDGKAIVETAAAAVAKAQEGGGWNNEPVLAAAPHSAKVNKYITNKQMLVVSAGNGDLVTCIQAATIDSNAMMQEVSQEEMIEFFLYCREVNSTVADARTKATGHLTRICAANDLTGIKALPDKDFQAALTDSSKLAVNLYPGYSGPTVLLNLPWVARVLVGLLAPFFPGAVKEKLKFARVPMDYMEDLTSITQEPMKSAFVSDFEAVLQT